MCFRPPAISTGEAERECPACGTINDGDETSCTKCNAVLSSIPSVAAPPPVGAPGHAKKPPAPPAAGAAKPKVPGGIPKVPRKEG